MQIDLENFSQKAINEAFASSRFKSNNSTIKPYRAEDAMRASVTVLGIGLLDISVSARNPIQCVKNDREREMLKEILELDLERRQSLREKIHSKVLNLSQSSDITEMTLRRISLEPSELCPIFSLHDDALGF